MIPVGSIIKTNYGTGPYEVTHVYGSFTDPSYHDTLEYGDDAPESKPHYNIACCTPGDKSDKFYLNGYAKQGDRFLSVWDDDEIIIVSQSNVQLNLFIK